MDRSEHALIPEWLKSSGNVSGGGTTNHQFASSTSHSDDHTVSKPARNKSSVSICDHDIGRLFVSDRITSSNFRRSSSSNGSSHSRSYSSIGRSYRDRDWEKDIYDYWDKEKSVLGDNRHRDYSDPLGNILLSRFDKDMLKRSQSMITGKRGEVWPRKVAADSNSTNKSNHSNGNGVLGGGSVASGVEKAAFERDFPSLGAEETQATPEVGRVLSPGLSPAIQSLPIGTSVVIGGPGRTSALAEVPVIIGNNSTGVSSVQQTIPASSASVSPSTTTGLNMAETLAQGPSRARTTPQSSVGTQRLEELAIIQSRRLIPVTPPMPKALVLSPSEKPKPKIEQQQHQISSSHLVNHTPRGGPTKSDVPKTSNVGKLHVLKPARERNGLSPTAKDSLSPTNGSKVANSPLTVAPSAAGSAPLRSPSNNPDLAGADRKPAAALATVERRPTSQAQSRNDFFNLMRKKSSTSPHSAVPDPVPALSPPVPDKFNELIAEVTPQVRDAPLSDTFGGDCSTENRDDMARNGDACDGSLKFCNKGEKNSSADANLYPDEEEAAFLRSLGWEENAGEDEGLTEEEITDFYKEYMKLRPSSKLPQGMQQPRVPLLLNSDVGNYSESES